MRASFVFHSQTAQNAKREEKNSTAYATACVIIFQNANTTGWTATNDQNFGWKWIHMMSDGSI